MHPSRNWNLRVLLLACLGLAVIAGGARGADRVVINEVHFDPPEKRPLEFIELHNPGTNEVSLFGWTLEKFAFPPQAVIAPGGFVVVAKDPTAFAKAFGFAPLGPLPGRLRHQGEKLTLRDRAGRIADEVGYGVGFPWPTAAAGGGASLERVNPGLPGTLAASWRSAGFPVEGKPRDKRPTPGKVNSVFATNAPPAFAHVAHAPLQPRAGERVVVTAEVGNPLGLRAVTLLVQVVEPGAYLRKSDPAYEQNWRELPMRDEGKDGDERAGDGVFTTIIPAETQAHRRLVRYRVTATNSAGLSVRVPYADDDCPNFAYFCHNGLPAWTGASQPGKTPPVTFPAEFMGTLPTYHLLANRNDVERCQWDGGANKKRFFGTLVYEGRVHDHIAFHNRGQASTYVSGKNKWGFHFNRAREFQPRDMWGRAYPHSWDNFDMNACASPWVQVNRGLAGMDEAVSFRAYHLAGVPSASTHWVHFRVITGTEEASAKSQYEGDLWGLYLVVQAPDGAWQKDRGLPDGNTYSHESGRKHLAAGMPADNSDWGRFMNQSRQASPESWWRTNLNLPAYYSFHAINRVVSNVDLRHGGNHYFYHDPAGPWSPVPWDLDMMFIPKTHWPGIIDQTRCLDLPPLRREYQNRAREILDLLCSDAAPDGGQIGQLVAECARVLCPAGSTNIWPELDRAMWNWHPRTSHKGAFYQTPFRQGMMGGEFERRLATPDFAGSCKFLTEFCTDSRPQKNYQPNDGNQLGYGFGHLWWESKDAAIPTRPTIRYAGPAGHAADQLRFQVSPFASPVATNTCAAVQWRVGVLIAPGLPGYVAGQPCRYELEPHWMSAELANAPTLMHLPPEACPTGRTCRVRARYRDQTGRWSHWSEPVQFVAGTPGSAPRTP